MEPKLPSPDRGPDFRSTNNLGGEAPPPSSRQEKGLEQLTERLERTAESVPSAESAPAPPVVTPVPAAQPQQDDGAAVVLPLVPSDDTPATANDSESIEKEWVIKAKKVVAETKDDPYRREQEVNKLQADYLFKRYGRVLGSSQE